MEINIPTPTIKGMKTKLGFLARPFKKKDKINTPGFSTTMSTIKIENEEKWDQWRKNIEEAHNVKFIHDKSLDRVHFWHVFSKDPAAQVIASILIIDVKDQNLDYDLEVFVSDPTTQTYPWDVK